MSSSIKPVLGSQLEFGHSLATGLVGLWLLNEGSGNKVFDLSGNGKDGIFSGDVSWAAGKFGSSILYGGTAGHINLGSDFLGTTPITIIAWINPATLGDNNQGRIIDNSQIIFRMFTSSDIIATSNGGGTELTATGNNIILNAWQQVAFTRDSSGASSFLYINGIEEVPGDTGTPASGGTVYTGDRADGLRSFNGMFDHLVIYNRVLSASEIALLYREPFIMFERDPIELWVGATSVGVPIGNAGIMTTNAGFWGPTF